MEKPRDLWRRELAGTDALVYSKLERCVAHVAASDVDTRCWAVDASRGRGGASPKFWVAARLDVFAPVYMRLPPRRRHAYEVLLGERRCRPFFDLIL